METYQEFLNRINSFEKNCWSFAPGDFEGNPSLVKKVGPDNTFRPFFGDTVVFDLDDTTKERMAKWLDELYANAPECFSERLAMDTFHLTLHDLCNSGNLSEIAEEVETNREKVRSLCKKIPKYNVIKMKSKCIFNMVNTSLVLGLYPADEEEHRKLVTLYKVFDEVKELPYPLTPHITLAYYSVHGFSDASARKLEELVCQLNCGELESEMEIVLEVKKLYYQHFDSMNHYTKVLPVYGE